jgi:hypothetical protein
VKASKNHQNIIFYLIDLYIMLESKLMSFDSKIEYFHSLNSVTQQNPHISSTWVAKIGNPSDLLQSNSILPCSIQPLRLVLLVAH